MTMMTTTIDLSESAKKILLRILSIIMLMEMLDATVLNTALPQIANSLQVNPIQLKEILTVYFLSLGVFIPVSGWAADRFGEKKALLFAIALFTASSVACGLAVNLTMLTAFRLLQGIGGAFLMPIGRQIIFRTYSGIERTQAMAKINSMTFLGLLLGPVIGGALTTYANWRWIFFINVPMGILGFYMIRQYLPVMRETESAQFDLWGFILIGLSLGSLLFFIDIAIDLDFSIYFKLLLLAVAAGSLLTYIPYAKRAASPLISLEVFNQRDFSTAALGSFFARLTLTTQPFLVPLLLQAGYGYNAMQSGLLSVPVLLTTLFTMIFLPRIMQEFNHHRLLLRNTGLLMLVFSSYYFQAVHLLIPLLIVQQILIGFLMPVQAVLMNANTYGNLPRQHATAGVTINSGIIQVSGSFGIALAALTMIAVIGPNDLQHQVPLIAFKIVFLVQNLYLAIALWFFIATEQ